MLKKFFAVLVVVFLSINLLSSVSAQDQNVGSITSGSDSTCPNVVITDKNGAKTVKLSQIINGDLSSNQNNNSDTETYTIGGKTYSRSDLLKAFNDQYVKLACPPKITGLQTLFLRLLVIVNTITGAVLLFVLIKAGFTRMTARSNPEAVKKASAMITNAIMGVVVVIIAYTVIVFIGTTLLPEDPCTRFSFVDSGRILFFFNQSDISPIQDSDPTKCYDPNNLNQNGGTTSPTTTNTVPGQTTVAPAVTFTTAKPQTRAFTTGTPVRIFVPCGPATGIRTTVSIQSVPQNKDLDKPALLAGSSKSNIISFEEQGSSGNKTTYVWTYVDKNCNLPDNTSIAHEYDIFMTLTRNSDGTFTIDTIDNVNYGASKTEIVLAESF